MELSERNWKIGNAQIHFEIGRERLQKNLAKQQKALASLERNFRLRVSELQKAKALPKDSVQSSIDSTHESIAKIHETLNTINNLCEFASFQVTTLLEEENIET